MIKDQLKGKMKKIIKTINLYLIDKGIANRANSSSTY
jgi:hypothetical protein